MEAPPFVDVHTHGRMPIAGLRVVNADPGTFGSDAATEPYLSLGVHPWNTGHEDVEARLDWLERQASRPCVAAIGECGLDRLRGAALPVQARIFVRQIKLAERLGKPLMIHCVKAFDELMQLKRQHRISVPMIVHGFNVRERTGARLIREGFWLSFGAALLRPGSAAATMIRTVPEDRFFLETDEADESIVDIYAAAAALRQTPLPQLRDVIWNNFRRLFLHE